MKTRDFIAVLAVSPPSRPRVAWTILLAAVAGAGAIMALPIFLAGVGPRPDLATALPDPRVAFKFVFAAACACAGFALCRRALRPEQPPRLWPWLAVALVILAGAGAELALTPSSTWLRHMIGVTPGLCVSLIVAISILPAAGLLLVLREGAPRSPGAAGAGAGLCAGGIGAAIFALNCPNDSALYVSVWYVAGVSVAAAASAVIGRRILAW